MELTTAGFLSTDEDFVEKAMMILSKSQDRS